MRIATPYEALTSQWLARPHGDAMTNYLRFVLLVTTISGCSTTRSAAPTLPTGEIAELAARRAHAIQALHAYREAGVYPTDESGAPLSVFRDAKGVRCPMAELIHDSGRDDLVDEVAKTANNVRLADVHTGPLFDWMLHSGLTLDEIAMVQGAMTVEEMQMMEATRATWLAAAKAEVRGRLATAETALQNGTGHALTVMAAKADAPHVATGPVVPKMAIRVVPAVPTQTVQLGVRN
jgi:hypothetical protein